MDQNHDRNSARREKRQSGESVLANKETFLHPPHAGNDQPSHQIQEMGQGQAAASAKARARLEQMRKIMQ